MKKIKKSLAVVLSLAMVITMLSACTSSNGSTGSDPKPTTEDPKPTEEVVTTTEVEPTEPTTVEEPTEEPTTTEVVETTPDEDAIIPLFEDDGIVYFNNYEALSAFDWLYFQSYYEIEITDDEYQNRALWKLSDVDVDFAIMDEDSGEARDADVYFSADEQNTILFFVVVDGTFCRCSGFVPLYYNQTKSSFVGFYINYTDQTVEVVEATYVDGFTDMYTKPVEDPSIYGL